MKTKIIQLINQGKAARKTCIGKPLVDIENAVKQVSTVKTAARG